ncbi:hypothetical protein PUNSTDRAFT_134094 [Punctularia strigosozonata HHB-11173 SS5]|uniref:uncharacterized protein n=1 Tax=Punctularia strigosozonata (strain HHB-11173) TaxID=741275 RepID=UPI0004417B9A|nr:uncharacterized protein PUNSTDRAFT_134094 [Punctularia strigosozonata HHB-11173 SS5]EIN08920.1 hypothetical protein PUNSTDRAFT_134094 [Punctularia strigosozonata HHB-11173 SS5]
MKFASPQTVALGLIASIITMTSALPMAEVARHVELDDRASICLICKTNNFSCTISVGFTISICIEDRAAPTPAIRAEDNPWVEAYITAA